MSKKEENMRLRRRIWAQSRKYRPSLKWVFCIEDEITRFYFLVFSKGTIYVHLPSINKWNYVYENKWFKLCYPPVFRISHHYRFSRHAHHCRHIPQHVRHISRISTPCLFLQICTPRWQQKIAWTHKNEVTMKMKSRKMKNVKFSKLSW